MRFKSIHGPCSRFSYRCCMHGSSSPQGACAKPNAVAEPYVYPLRGVIGRKDYGSAELHSPHLSRPGNNPVCMHADIIADLNRTTRGTICRNVCATLLLLQ